jgi:putative endonuclease
MAKTGYIYIMTNWNNQVIYTGVTSDLKGRAYQHRNGLVKGFTSRFNCTKLVYYEIADTIESAIQREKQIKNYSRMKKIL